MRAIALISGGLDSILAARLIEEQGIDILPVNFKMPFAQRHKERDTKGSSRICQLAQSLETVDISDDFLKLLISPRYGFGVNMNPCLDCKILMLTKAKELMAQQDARFVVTGEVVGQRPMSQYRQALELIERKAGLEALVLRPLSARLLSETIPETEGWVNRDRLLNFSGRSRRPQMKLAEELSIKEYSQPAGGCLLTDAEFSRRLKSLIANQELNKRNVELLKLGRHFRLSVDASLIVGRCQEENIELERLSQDQDCLFYPTDELAGPTSLGRGAFDEHLIRIAAAITCRYCDLNGRKSAGIVYKSISKNKGPACIKKNPVVLDVLPIDDSYLGKIRI